MDTTAAAELGGGVVVDGGVGFWDTVGGAGEAEQQQQQQREGWGKGGGHNRPSGFAGPNVEPPAKRMRNMNNGGGDGYGSGSGNFNNASSMPGFAPGDSDPGLRVVYGPGGGQGGSPGLKNNFPAGVPNSAYPQGPPPAPLPPGMPTGDQSAQGQGMPRGRGMGSIFYKTKLCSRFRSGNCPYNTNCNFAHGMDELRRPPPGWEDAAGSLEGGGPGVGGGVGGGNDGGAGGGGGGNGGVGSRGGGGNGGLAGGTNANVAPSNLPGSSQGPNEGPNQGLNQGISQGPTPAGGNMNDLQRFHKTRPCKKYFSEMGCPYGDRCNFLHDETNPQLAPKPGRESVVVTVVGNGGASMIGPTPPAAGGVAAGGGPINQRPPNWKTRLCNKWETTGNCPFGEKCHFAHGTAELQRYGGGPIDSFSLEGGAASQMDSKFGMNSSGNNFGDGDEGLPIYPDTNPQIGNMRQLSGHLQQQAPRPSSGVGSKSAPVWKGPTTGISTIYGDWPEDFEWIAASQQKYGQPMPLAGQKGIDFSSEPVVRKEKDQQNTSPFLKPSNGSAGIFVQA